MKKLLSICLLILLCLSPVYAAEQDITAHADCDYCGMDRSKFAHSRIMIEYADGSSAALCSLHCAAVEFAVRIDKTPLSFMVGDYNTKQLIDAKQANWVLGGEKFGVMTTRAKWAFADTAAAEQFIQQNGGMHADFDQVIKAAYEDMYSDTKMIHKKRQAKRMKKKHSKAGG